MESRDYYQPPGATAALPEQFADAPLFALDGRLGRVRYLAYSFLAGLVTLVPMAMLAGMAQVILGEGALVAGVGLGYVAMFAFGIVLAIRRCHDFGSSGWLSVISLVPLLNLVLFVIPGTDGANRFGPRTRPNSVALVVLAFIVPLSIVSILAAVALPAYNEYIDNANMAKVNSHYEEGARFVTNEMRKHRAMTALGRASTLPDTSEGWIELINPAGALAPSGDAAYQAGEGARDGSGVVGVDVTGTAADDSLVVTLHRPAYQELEATQVDISLAQL